MRNVLKNIQEVTHVWARQGQERGESGSLSFEGPVLLSYSTVIARHVSGPNGRASLVTGESRSVTTSRHTGLARRAVVHSFPLPGEVGRTTTPEDGRAQWAARMADLAWSYGEAKSKPSRAKGARLIRAAVTDANALCAFFELPLFDSLPEDAELSAYLAEKGAAEKERRAGIEARRLAAEVERAAEEATRLSRWLAGERVHVPYRVRDVSGDCLRVLPDGETVETTQGAYFPLSDARRAAPLVLRLASRGRDWHTNGLAFNLGIYRVDRIEADGTLYAGCHRIQRGEIERFAAVIGATVAPEEITNAAGGAE